ncbi:hypothetical protein Tco_0954950 [Tanacetum coccineum]|uniref:Reverse transcriptase domain-containing protein n=1 Tax=Tanacetum coccineum TaxID=301880 RepID=A0ABQ5E5W2_9ASTR
MANTTLIVTTVTKTATKEKTPKETDAAPRVNILDFCEEHYEDILSVIMDKIRRNKRKEVHTRLDFGDNTKRSRRIREGSQNSSAGTLSVRYRNPSERPKVKDCSKDNDGNVKGARHGYHSRDRDRPRIMKRGRESESSLSRVSKSSTSDEGHWKSKSKRHKPTDEDDLEYPGHAKRRPRGSRKKNSSRSTGGTLGNAYMVSYVQLYPNRNRESVQKKYVKDPVEIHNIKQRDGETIEDFMERFKVKTGRMKGASECM